MALKLVEQQYHCAEVTGADACVRRPVVATCSLDRTLRVWHVHDRCTPDFLAMFCERGHLCYCAFTIRQPPGVHRCQVACDVIRQDQC